MGKRKVNETTRYAILHELLKRSIDGVLPYGLKTSVAKHVDVHRDTVAAIWSRYKESVAAGNIAGDISCRYKGRSGRKGYNRQELEAKSAAVPAERRSTIRSTAACVGVSLGVIQRLLASHALVAKTTTIKPILKTTHRQRRMQYAMSFLDDKPDVHRDKIGHRFDPMLNIVHVDEKWFNHDKNPRRYYLLSGEDPPERHRHSACHIEKTMFLAAVARLRWDPHRKTNFNGKLGLWPFAEEYVAQRSSQYRPKGTILQRNIESVDTAVYKHLLLTCVFSANREKWPRGYFSAIQSLQYQTYVASTLELIEVVQKSFRILDNATLDNIFLTLQQVMVCVLACDGGNEYKLPHMGKAKQRRNGTLVQCVVCSSEVYSSAVSKLSSRPRPGPASSAAPRQPSGASTPLKKSRAQSLLVGGTSSSRGSNDAASAVPWLRLLPACSSDVAKQTELADACSVLTLSRSPT
ncbi:hypothetical protein PPTG_19010 [Phytophthora nicotianae INRA-310]|uniref:DUF7769 domain-containing protein n=1 Tax=Phytophthora nicotianae (strain INRA-310) TaxID=761204 RepID=W2PG16_PHYN3|nr:hypothetical protein PPTG_19010 [Phytophthora nicotianae INRA-310]ETM99158.1 hypothetical protein PPTG_19010 [Phytophthora nicotianae INRA-310]